MKEKKAPEKRFPPTCKVVFRLTTRTDTYGNGDFSKEKIIADFSSLENAEKYLESYSKYTKYDDGTYVFNDLHDMDSHQYFIRQIGKIPFDPEGKK